MHPHFLVIGAQKAGSTFLVQALRSHPDIYMPASEIPCFEDPDYGEGGVERLEALLNAGQASACVGVKRALWLAADECAMRIAGEYPHVKLLAILRHPIERAVSSLFHLMHARKVPLLQADEAFNQILDGALHTQYPAAESVLVNGLYYRHLSRYMDYFDRANMHLMLFDDLVSTPRDLVGSMYQFLGVDETHTYDRPGSRPMASSYSYARLRILRTLQPTYTRLSSDGLRRYPRKGFVAPILRTCAGGLDRYVLSSVFSADRPTLHETTLARLREYYRDDVHALETLLDRHLSSWMNGGG